jgi:hypothetical protein
MTAIVHVFTFLEHILFREPETKGHHQARLCLLITLFLIGIIYWIFFFHAGNLSLLAEDWWRQNVYLKTLREAQTSGVIPFQWIKPYFDSTQKFLSNPEVVMTPDIFLLRWIPNGIFVTIHVLLLYAIGFFGSLQVARKLKASFIAFFFFWLVFNFNGFITAHLGVGHLWVTGYFLLPFFFTLFESLIESQNKTAAIKYSFRLTLLLGLLFLNGSFHVAIWCCIFMAITVLWRREKFLHVVSVILIGGLFGLNHLLPAALWYHLPGYKFLAGFPNSGTLMDGFTFLRGYVYKFHDLALGWWEYDYYVGGVALIILLICFIFSLKRRKLPFQLHLYFAGLFMLLLSLDNVFALISRIPIASTDRVSTRFLVMPFMLFLITATAGIDEFIRSWPRDGIVAALITLPLIAYELFRHSILWQIKILESSFSNLSQPLVSLIPNLDKAYAFSIYASWIISLVSLVLAVVLYFVITNRLRRESTEKNSSLD